MGVISLTVVYTNEHNPGIRHMQLIFGLDINFNQGCVRGLKIKSSKLKKVSTLKVITSKKKIKVITSAGTFSLT